MRRRIVGVATAVTAMVVLAFAIPLGVTIRNLAYQSAVAEVEVVAQGAARSVTRSLSEGLPLADAVGDAEVPEPMRLWATSGDTGAGDEISDPTLVEDAATGTGVARRTPAGVGVALPVVSADDEVALVVVVESEDDGMSSTLLAWTVLAVLSVSLVGLAAFVGDRMASGLVASVGELADGAEALAAGDLDVRIDAGGPEEVAVVAASLNRLGSRIRGLLRRQREEVADHAHRLRTPLAALRLEVEGTAAERSVIDLSEAVDRLIAEIREPIEDAAAPVGADVSVVVRDRVRFWSVLAEDEGRSLTLRAANDPTPAAIAGEDLAVVVDALLGNVVQHTEPPVGATVTVLEHPDEVEVSVEDDGPGWPEGDVFARGSSGGGSTGLGLDIVRRRLESIGGSVVAYRAPGGGAGIRLRIPTRGNGPDTQET